jgi:hypothetical protein
MPTEITEDAIQDPAPTEESPPQQYRSSIMETVRTALQQIIDRFKRAVGKKA